jgi:major membrane immunogen (membrane-anchored lipoprotein)
MSFCLAKGLQVGLSASQPSAVEIHRGAAQGCKDQKIVNRQLVNLAKKASRQCISETRVSVSVITEVETLA